MFDFNPESYIVTQFVEDFTASWFANPVAIKNTISNKTGTRVAALLQGNGNEFNLRFRDADVHTITITVKTGDVLEFGELGERKYVQYKKEGQWRGHYVLVSDIVDLIELGIIRKLTSVEISAVDYGLM